MSLVFDGEDAKTCFCTSSEYTKRTYYARFPSSATSPNGTTAHQFGQVDVHRYACWGERLLKELHHPNACWGVESPFIVRRACHSWIFAEMPMLQWSIERYRMLFFRVYSWLMAFKISAMPIDGPTIPFRTDMSGLPENHIHTLKGGATKRQDLAAMPCMTKTQTSA